MELRKISLITGLIIASFFSCNKEENTDKPKDPDKAEVVSVDRFSDAAGTLMKRSADASLPGVNEPVDFDNPPLITQSFGPGGEIVEYYNFDVQPVIPAPIYVLVRSGDYTPVSGQLNIIDVIPGDIGYNDFWLMVMVTVPGNYVANTVTSYQEIYEKKFDVVSTNIIVNCPVVPEGSTATKRYGSESNSINRGWYQGKVVYYFTFSEAPILTNTSGEVPLSPVYVTFKINPDSEDPNSGPPSGFVYETGSLQTHNVIATIPGDADYSPLWIVSVYDNADFDNVSDLSSALAATIVPSNPMNVNCPIVSVNE